MSISSKELEKIKSQAKRFNVRHNVRSYSSTGTRPEKPALIRVVVHNCGNRIELSNKMFEDLKKPAFVEIDYTDDYLIFKACESGGYKISNPPKAKNPIVYCKELAETIMQMFECNDNNRASHAFCDGELVDDVYLINVKKRSEPSEEALGEATGDSEAKITETEENFEEEASGEATAISEAEIAETEENFEEESDHGDEVLEEEETLDFEEEDIDEEPDHEFNEE